MTWVEIVVELAKAVTPVVLGVAGILGTVWGARHQSRTAVEAERRARAFIASAELLAVAQQVFFYLTMWRSSQELRRGEVPTMTFSPEKVLAQANSSVGVCYIYGGELSDTATKLLACVTGTLSMFEVGATDEETSAAYVELRNAFAAFTRAAREANDVGTVDPKE